MDGEASVRLAVIDMGTVTTRLLVADLGPDGLREVVRRSRITHLGDGWTGTGRLSSEAIARVAAAAAEYAGEAHALGAEEVVALATSAARDAANADELADALARSGIELEVVSGDREAALTFAGATYALGGDGTLVVDVGGGSTELVLGSSSAADGAPNVVAARSIDVGSKRITELFLHSDPPAPREIEHAQTYVTDELRPFFATLKERPRRMISVAGTATSLAAIDMSLDPYDPERVHGYALSGAAISDALERLASMTLAERKQVVGLEPDRASVIVAGALILQTALALSGLDSTLVSEHDILYGAALDRYASRVGRPAGGANGERG
ncbi:Ppx/GppA family phosphatase [Coriobacteriia bacterium Es71-Z0120]|uniref:Ppx/GppA phosphatase family protein n=1 Tax=Parvivirga hydrogeniphila TaxID=2939460 RepID=UPI002260AEEF|nr:Ppx/GppA family phosphatase [Parvivirga hydrogeniphila]MCL4078403.1 Ppx/GppA family phosphatase [Parvivirga hydrogeniphila]